MEEGEIQNTWENATITPLLKEGIDPKNVRSYRLVALTNILCKIFKNMTKKEITVLRNKEEQYMQYQKQQQKFSMDS